MKKIRILKLPLWLFILLSTLLTVFIVLGIIVINAIIQFRKPVKTNPVITDVKVESVEIINDLDQIVLDIGDEYNIEYTVYPVDAVNKNVSFASSDSSIATVTESGLVTGISGGIATITITTQDGNYTDSIIFVIKTDYNPTETIPLEEIQEVINAMTFSSNVINDAITIELDEPLLIEIPSKEDFLITYDVSDANILSINNSSNNELSLLPISSGEVTITITIEYHGEKVVKEYTVTINDEVINNPTITNINVLGVTDYYQNSKVDTNDIKLVVSYDNDTTVVISLYEYDPNMVIDTFLLGCDDPTKELFEKSVTFEYIDEYENKQFVYIGYNVIKLNAISIDVTGLNSIYALGEAINITNIHIVLNNGEERNLTIDQTISNIDEIDMNVLGHKELSIKYLDYEVVYVFSVEEAIYRIVGLNNSYEVNSIIDYTNVYLEKVIDNTSTKYYLKDLYNDSELKSLIDTSSETVIDFKIEYLGNTYSFGSITIKKAKVLDKLSILNLKNEYYIFDSIDTNNLVFRFIYDDLSYIDKTYEEIKSYLSSEINTNTAGENNYTINYLDKEFSFNINVIYYKVDATNLNNFNKYYVLGETVDLRDCYVTLYCNNASVVKEIKYSNLTITPVSSNELGEFSSTITISEPYLENSINITYNYSVVNPMKLVNDSYVSFGSTFKFIINIDKAYYRDDYDITVNNNASFNVNSINKNSNGNFEVEVTLVSGKQRATVTCYLKGTKANVQVQIKKIQANDTSMTYTILGGSGYRLINNSITLEITASYDGKALSKDDYSYLTFIWGGMEFTPDASNPRRITINSSISGSFVIKCTVSDGSKEKEVSTTINYCDEPVTNLGFSLGSIAFGIGKEYVLASKYLANPLTQSNPKVMIYTFDVFGSKEIDKSKLVFYVKEEDKDIANFIDNKLNVYEDGYVTLYVSTTDAINLGYTDDKYIGIYIGTWKVRCIGNSLYVTNYTQMKFAFDNGYKVVLASDIMYGPEVMDITYDKETGIVSRTLKSNYSSITAISTLNSYLYKLDSTWNTKYLENLAVLNNKEVNKTINAVVNITNDLYGNGYTIDLSQYTTLSQALTNTTPPFFNGPLKFLEALSIVRVYGQDDIGFLVRDNVTIDNVTLQNCDSGYLRSNNKLDYSKLNKVGTVLEVMGDNVTIRNSRLLNGRNILRIYGKSNFDEKIHVTIDKCIISNAREYLIKIGANKSLHTDTVMMYDDKLTKVTDFYTKYGMKMDKVSKNILKGIEGNNELLYESSSPYLKDDEGYNYEPLDYSNINDPYFVSNYLMTDVTLKDSVLEGCGFFAICLDSCFAGPVLGGYQYAPKDIDLGLGGFDYNGIYDINSTSYAAILRLVGDVRIYNWKDIDEFDSSTIMEQINNAQALLKLVGEDTKFEFDIKEILNNVAPTDATIIANSNGKTYAHGGIIFYGGGKNYNILDTSLYTGYTLSTHNVSMNQMGNSTFVKCIPWVAGTSNFRFVMYDSTSTLSYELQEELYRTNQAYSNIN